MVRNDFVWDMKEIFHRGKKSKEEVAKELGVSVSNLYQYSYHTSVTGSCVGLCEDLGYDIEVRYVPKGEGEAFSDSVIKLLKSCGETQTSYAAKKGVSKQYINSIVSRASISKGFRSVAKSLGFDMKLEFLKRD